MVIELHGPRALVIAVVTLTFLLLFSVCLNIAQAIRPASKPGRCQPEAEAVELRDEENAA